MRLTERLPSFESVVAGSTAVCKLPIGRTYHAIFITYSGVTLAQMNELRVVANGKVIQRLASGTFADVLTQFTGRAAAAGVLTIDFDRINMLTRAGEEFTKIGTGDPTDQTPIVTMRLEIDIDAAAAAPALSAKAVQSEPSILGLIRKIRHFTYNAPAAGDYEISDLPKGDLIGRIIFDNANINSLKIERDNRTVFERTAAENSLIQTDGKRVPQAGYFIYDPSELGYSSESLATAGVNDLRFTLNMAALGAIPVTVEYIGPLGD